MTDEHDIDVLVCGGGMAGLTLAMQLRARLPEATVTVLEPKRRPLQEACFKVGESTVEVGARYLGTILGLHDYLLDQHLPKNGLRFYSGRPGAPIEARAEMGPPEPPRLAAYQIDRGRLENDLRAMCVERGVDLREGWAARDVELDGAGHRVTAVKLRAEAAPVALRARWVVDATGPRRMIAKKLGLEEPLAEQAGAAWFRVPARVEVAQLVGEDQRAWHDRDVDGRRWLSTCHLAGRGYWVWVIPLANGHTSLGLVAEESCHAFTSYSTEAAMDAWLAEHEPHLATRLEGVEKADFASRKDFRVHVDRAFSKDRWACVGEAGLFVDPLYSPGADMIAIGNCMLTELIVDDLSGDGLDEARLEELNGFALSWGRMLQRTLPGGSRVFGSPEALSAKLYWDYYYYWALLCPYFFQDLYRLPVAEHRRFSEMLRRWRALNDRAQTVLAAYGRVAGTEPREDYVGLPWPATTLSDLHLDLLNEKEPAQAYDDMARALEEGEELVLEVLLRALRRAGPSLAADVAREVGLDGWEVPEARLAADEAPPRKRRKLLTKLVRDLERSVGKNAPESDDAPRLRELWSIARGA